MTHKEKVWQLFQQAGHDNELTNHDIRAALPEVDYKAVEDSTRALFKEGKLDRRWDAVRAGVTFGSYRRIESGRELFYKLGSGQQQTPDRCQFCLGAKGGVLGNENRFGDIIACDSCSVLVSIIRNRHPDVARLDFLENNCLEVSPADTYLNLEYESGMTLRGAIDEARGV